ncbi:hypothetical protein WJX84_007658 [Apatococcus fuscideae]|uniref:Uncharacterized protein n=1 Tax=Apatococcus fuscideae TaxID=2026836 RepID=A0AAW1SYL0_9CHLO
MSNMPALASLPWTTYAVAGLAVFMAWKLQRFARADADLRLLSKHHPSQQSFKGQVIWIIGASQGLGEELAKWFAAHGAHLILSSRRLDQLQRVAGALYRTGSEQQIQCLPFDLLAAQETLEAAVRDAHTIADAWATSVPGITHLVLNAGVGQAGAAEDTPRQVPAQLLELNSVAPIRLTQALLPFWLSKTPPHHTPQQTAQDGDPHSCSAAEGEPPHPTHSDATAASAAPAVPYPIRGSPTAASPAQPGAHTQSGVQPQAEVGASSATEHLAGSSGVKQRRITVVSSMAAKVPSPGQALYAASKAALHGYYHSLASELADRGIGVTICCPGPIAATQEGQMRAVWGAQGLTSKPAQVGSGSRQHSSRVASLIGTATYHGLQECWISKHPILILGYIFQLLPALGHWIMTIIGPKRVAQYRGGGGGYDLGSMLKRSARQ